MKTDYCLGLCPLCKGNGLLRAVKDARGIFVFCDECYQEFSDPENVLKNNGWDTLTFNDVSVPLEEAIGKGWADYIYIFADGKWIKYTDRSVVLS